MEIYEYLYPIVQHFHLCGKKNRETNRETHTNLRMDCLDKPRRGALIFFVRGADVYWRCQKIYPQ